MRSSLEIVDLSSRTTRSIYRTPDLIEAPHWTREGTALYFNSDGRIFRLVPDGVAQPQVIDTGFATRCNNDHGLSPDGAQLVISDQTRDGSSRIYVLPANGGAPREVTPLAPSYWHGWSPDGKTVAYCAKRDGKFGIFTIPAAGGEERRLTITDGLDDGPDYSPDGRWIYFNSDRTGRMQIWRMHPDGTQLEQITADAYNNWFPHPSPCGDPPKSGPLVMLVCGLKRNPDHERQKTHDRTEDPHIAGSRWRQKHRGDLPGEGHIGGDLPPLKAAVRDDGDPGGPSPQGTGGG
jgi:Tol biopolymer transport system component